MIVLICAAVRSSHSFRVVLNGTQRLHSTDPGGTGPTRYEDIHVPRFQSRTIWPHRSRSFASLGPIRPDLCSRHTATVEPNYQVSPMSLPRNSLLTQGTSRSSIDSLCVSDHSSSQGCSRLRPPSPRLPLCIITPTPRSICYEDLHPLTLSRVRRVLSLTNPVGM